MTQAEPYIIFWKPHKYRVMDFNKLFDKTGMICYQLLENYFPFEPFNLN